MNDGKYKKRKEIRLKYYDYSQEGYYFVTICTKDRKHLFGEVACGKEQSNVGETVLGLPRMKFTDLGLMVDNAINYTDENISGVNINKYIIMPNHIHLIIVLSEGDRGRSPLQYIVRNLKSFITKKAGRDIWQKSFYEHVIRNEKSYLKIWEYIDNNLLEWEMDEYYG